MNTRSTIIGRSFGLLLSAAVAVAVTVTVARSQDTAEASSKDLKLGPTPQELTPDQKRESKRVADIVAGLFQERRKQAKLPHVWRFHCSTMQQVACSSAQTGAAWATGRPQFQAMYWTDKPETSHPELERIATYDTRPKDHGGFSADRFSVVVWPTIKPKGYWIGLDLHPNALAQAWRELDVYISTCDGPCPKLPIALACQKQK